MKIMFILVRIKYSFVTIILHYIWICIVENSILNLFSLLKCYIVKYIYLTKKIPGCVIDFYIRKPTELRSIWLWYLFSMCCVLWQEVKAVEFGRKRAYIRAAEGAVVTRHAEKAGDARKPYHQDRRRWFWRYVELFISLTLPGILRIVY